MKLCVALDMVSRAENLALAKSLAPFGNQIWLKVGLRSYLRDGAKFIDDLQKITNFKIFLDLKFYDIPNTMADASEVVAKLGVDMINLQSFSRMWYLDSIINLRRYKDNYQTNKQTDDLFIKERTAFIAAHFPS